MPFITILYLICFIYILHYLFTILRYKHLICQARREGTEFVLFSIAIKCRRLDLHGDCLSRRVNNVISSSKVRLYQIYFIYPIFSKDIQKLSPKYILKSIKNEEAIINTKTIINVL